MSREYRLEPFRHSISLQIDYARELNPQQLAAVTSPPGPALVIAGAGAGKTRTLIYRVAYLLEQGVPPAQILLLTFTNKAAREMMRRVADLLGAELSGLWGGTFHAVAHRVLRQHAELVGYRRDFTILDREDSADLIKACLGKVPDDLTQFRFPKPDVLAEIFSFSANTVAPLAQVLADQYNYFSDVEAQIEAVRRLYDERKKAAQAMDFDDLLRLFGQLLRDHAEARELYQRRFQFVLVDEYQDTNRLQSDLVDLLAERHHNLMVVGDDAQSIYSWRGAHFENIFEFPARYPKAALFKIETNYRSTPEILELANAAIAPNSRQHQKHLTAARKPGSKPVLAVCPTTHEQSAFVARRALELREEGIELSDMAVLYRSHFHALELQLELTRRNIPFSITSGIRFFEQAHVKDVAAFLKWALNPRDEVSFQRILRLLPGVGPRIAERISSRFEAERRQAPASATLARLLEACRAATPKKAQAAWAQFSATIHRLESIQPPKAREMITLVVEAIYEEHLQRTYPNYRARLEDLQQLAAFAKNFSTLEEFLAQMALLTQLEGEESEAKPDREIGLRLSTVHQAKGLEFEVVFIIMLCDGLFPAARSLDNPAFEEEERRLFYVAVTRAKSELYLAYPTVRPKPGSGADAMQKPSRFLAAIPPELLDVWELRMSGAWM